MSGKPEWLDGVPLHEPKPPSRPLPCPFCGDVGRMGPDAAWYFDHGVGCWIGTQFGTMLGCVSWDELERWNERAE
jgi:hypothetical protein